VPTWRSTKDVTTEVDLIEEVGRLQGYDQIQATPIQAPIVAPPRDPRRQLEHRLTQRLAGVHHCFESQSYSFLDDVWLERLSLPLSDFVVLDNPISDSMRLVRRDPVPSLLEQAHANLRERPSGQLFEFAKGYEPAVDGAAPIERRWLCVVAWAPVQKNESPLQSLFAHSRSMVEDVMATAGLSPHFEPADSVLAWAHPRLHMAARAHRGPEAARLGSFAALHPHLADDLGFDGYQVVVSLLDMSAIYEASKSAKPSFRSPSRLPGIKVDVALALPASLSYAEVEIEVRRAGGKLLDSLELFDLFEGGTLEPGQRSLAFRAVLRAPDRTLVEKDEQKFIKKVTQAAERLGGSLRG
ncbi:MAG: hypothetical protein HN961_03140, partial [Planctomycetes bacterium]|nr:hypothetical protein [Planctomycetota bacterium]